MRLGGVDGTHELREISVDGVKSIELMMDLTSNHSHDIGILAIAITSSLRRRAASVTPALLLPVYRMPTVQRYERSMPRGRVSCCFAKRMIRGDEWSAIHTSDGSGGAEDWRLHWILLQGTSRLRHC